MTQDEQSIFAEPKHVAVLRRLRIIKPEHRAHAFRRVILAMAVGWVPLAILCGVRWLVSGDSAALAFFSDVAVHIRLLLAVPVLILSEYIILPRLDATGQQFLRSNMIVGDDRERFDAIVTTTRRLSITIWPSTGMVILVYLLVFIVAASVPRELMPVWQRTNSLLYPSLAGWWHRLVSLPLVFGLLLSWVWRLGVWTRFLRKVSRMNLQLVASHPDKAGGLQFVAFSPRLFSPLAFAVGIITAGTMANEVIHLGLKPMDHAAIPLVTALVIVLLFISPPLVFARLLLATWRRGIFEYGGLAGRVGGEFETKWLSNNSKVDADSLGVPDFSATTDLYSVAANAYVMQPVLFDPRSALALAVAALLPFAPIWLSVIPAKTVLSHLIGMLI